MDTPDSRDPAPQPPVPYRAAPAPTPMPQAAWGGEPWADVPPAPKAFSPRVAWRAVRRHWWLILLIWGAGSAGLMALAYAKVKPSYEATAYLKIEPSRGVLGQTAASDFGTYLETQVALINSPDVLSVAVQDKKVAALPRVFTSMDPPADLRKEIRVLNVPKTHIILVSMASTHPAEPALIVNAVVDSYVKSASTWRDSETREQIARLEELKQDFKAEVERARTEVDKLLRKRADAAVKGLKDVVGPERFVALNDELTKIRLERVVAQSKLGAAREQAQRRRRDAANAGGAGRAAPTGEDLEAIVKAAFFASDAAQALQAERDEIEKKLELARRAIKRANDPALTKLNRDLAAVDAKWTALWDKNYPDLKRRASTNTLAPDLDGAQLEEGIRNLERQYEIELAALKTREQELQDQLKGLVVEAKKAGDEDIDLRLAQADFEGKRTTYDTIEKRLLELNTEAKTSTRITTLAKAKDSPIPSSDSRLKLMAAAPVGVLALTLALFMFVEIRSGRVADPDDLPGRVRVGVIGVVPPLPTARNSRTPRGLRDDRRRVEEFIQSLDHLRVALCASKPTAEGHPTSGRRCVLITSAVGGEGKTTLAAQLAGRCANAGLLTLLIDGDLRRPSLGQLLEVPEGPGLLDVLAGDIEPESALVVIGNAGGFHLLPAGTEGADPSRLLQGEKLGELIARFRETFDVVIVDAPPVLAVPDALLLGRWTDGALLSVRHDTSRFPLVERANRRLAAVGIPVLGAVVNGVRSMEAQYGGYSYQAQYGNPYAGRGAEAAEA